MKRVIVTGGGGFIGQAIVGRLREAGVEVTVIGRHHYPEVQALGAKTARGDIRDKAFLTRTCKDHDTIFHVAAKAGIWGSREDYYSINVTGTENVLAACRANNISRLIYTSTPSVVFARRDLAGADETTPYAEKFLCPYAETKVIAEKTVLAANRDGLLTCALRPHLVWGPGDPNLIPRLIKRGRKKQLRMVGQGDNLVAISYIDNVAAAHLLAAANLAQSASAAGRAYFIAQAEPVNLWAWINDLFARLDIPQVEKKISFNQAWMAGAVLEKIYGWLDWADEPRMTRFLAEQLAKSHWFSLTAAKRDLGYVPEVDTAEGLERVVRWIKENGL